MSFSSFRYLLKEGFRSIVANKAMSSASILVLIASMLLVGASVLFTDNMNAVLDFIATQNVMYADLEDNLDELVKDKIKSELDALDYVESVEYIPKEAGFKEWLDELGDSAHDTMYELAEDPPIQDSFRITLNDPEKTREIQVMLEARTGIVSVEVSTDVAESISKIRNLVATGGGFIVLTLTIVSLVIITNSIRMTMYNRRKEISIMKYVGATDAFIRLPFVVEGIIIGLIAAIVTYGLTFSYYTFLIKYLSEINIGGWITSSLGKLLPFKDVSLKLLIYFVIGGSAVGTVGSTLFAGKYLKV